MPRPPAHAVGAVIAEPLAVRLLKQLFSRRGHIAWRASLNRCRARPLAINKGNELVWRGNKQKVTARVSPPPLGRSRLIRAALLRQVCRVTFRDVRLHRRRDVKALVLAAKIVSVVVGSDLRMFVQNDTQQ